MAQKTGVLAKKLTGMTVPDLVQVGLAGSSPVPSPRAKSRLPLKEHYERLRHTPSNHLRRR